MTIPNAKAKFFLLKRQEMSAACAVIKLSELIPKKSLPMSMIL